MMSQPPLTWRQKLVLAGSIWYWHLRIRYRLKRQDIREIIQWLGAGAHAAPAHAEPRWLGRVVVRCLPFGLSHDKCLPMSLTLFRLLHSQGMEPELVIGLRIDATDHRAHAWVEVDGTDVGPPPGGRFHRPLTRYRAQLAAPSNPR